MTLLESFTARRMGDKWNDFVCVLFKGEWNENEKINYISDRFACENVWRFGADEILKAEALTEDQRIIEGLEKEVARLKSDNQRNIDKLQNEIFRLEAKIARRSQRTLLRRLRRFVSGAFPPLQRRLQAPSKL
jgi:hypothetical protein